MIIAEINNLQKRTRDTINIIQVSWNKIKIKKRNQNQHKTHSKPVDINKADVCASTDQHHQSVESNEYFEGRLQSSWSGMNKALWWPVLLVGQKSNLSKKLSF